MNSTTIGLLIAALLLNACSDDGVSDNVPRSTDGAPAPSEDLAVPAYERPSGPSGSSEHGERRELGSLVVAGHEYGVVLSGELATGELSGFDVEVADAALEDLLEIDASLWIESEDGSPLCAPSEVSVKLEQESNGTTAASGNAAKRTVHFHVRPEESDTVPARVVLRIRSGDTDASGSLPL